jgi:16S rRNA (cytidine1402-2'-O)-methyltransferase
VNDVIILAATPIGNLGDASSRLIEALEGATVIAAEDTRTTIQLMRLLGVNNKPELISLHEHNERERAAGLVQRAQSEDVLVLSDAGMPTVSDPGYALVHAAAEAGVMVTAIPGPSAVITALAVSGLPSDRFTFEGFVPRKSGDRASTFAALAAETRTMVFFEAPTRLHETLEAMAEAFGAERPAAVCRELTKKFEEVRRGGLGDLTQWSADGVRGEIVVVVGGAQARDISREDALELVKEAVASGIRLKDAARDVAALTGHSSRELYQESLADRAR